MNIPKQVQDCKHRLQACDDSTLRRDSKTGWNFRKGQHGTKPVIPNRSARKQPFSFNKRLYKLRWRIEAAFNRLKDFRRIATGYDKLPQLSRLCLSFDSPCLMDLMSLDASSHASQHHSSAG
jgi:transposase